MISVNALASILGDYMPQPKNGSGIPRCELYIMVENIDERYSIAILVGALSICTIAERGWGDKACYIVDFEGHSIAFAESM